MVSKVEVLVEDLSDNVWVGLAGHDMQLTAIGAKRANLIPGPLKPNT